MNYIRHLTGFFEKIQEDNRLNPTHISLYLALFQFWNLNHFQNPISISRQEMMKLSKISSFGTYHKCIKDLQEFGYIQYIPSFNPYKGSMVNLFNFDRVEHTNSESFHINNKTGNIQALNLNHIKIDTSFRQALEPSINNINLLKNKQIDTSPNTGSNSNQVFSTIISQTEISKYSKNKNMDENVNNTQVKSWKFPTHLIPPPFHEVKTFFQEKEVSTSEAEKFYLHYESNGWLIGGKSKMINWQAAAESWLLKTQSFEPVSGSTSHWQKVTDNHLIATTNKNYSEPL